MTSNSSTPEQANVKTPTPKIEAAAEATPAVAAEATAPRFDPDAIETAVRKELGQPSAADADRQRFDRAAEGARVRRSHQRQEGARERDADLGGARLKLSVRGELPGFHLYWENDEDGAIEQLLYDGFEFVTPEEVQMTSAFVSDADLGHRISRFVGKKSDGSPLRAYLLKCPNEIWAEREKHRYAQADTWDSAIKAGRIQHDEGRYTPKGVDISLNTQFKKQY